MKKLIENRFVDVDAPGIAWRLAHKESPATAESENRRHAMLHAAIMMRAPLTKRRGGVFNG